MIEFISLQPITQIPDAKGGSHHFPSSLVKIKTGQPIMKVTGIPMQIFSGYDTPFTYSRKITESDGTQKWIDIPRTVGVKNLTEAEINLLAATVYQLNPALASAPDFTQTNGKFAAGTQFEMHQTLQIPLNQIVPFTDLILNSVTLTAITGGFQAQWQNKNFVSEYILQYRLVGGEWVTVPVLDANTHIDELGMIFQDIEPLAAGDYEVQVKAVDAYREGDYSPISTITVSA